MAYWRCWEGKKKHALHVKQERTGHLAVLRVAGSRRNLASGSLRLYARYGFLPFATFRASPRPVRNRTEGTERLIWTSPRPVPCANNRGTE
jgi:hypothetical protein